MLIKTEIYVSSLNNSESSFYGSDLERSLPSGWTNERRLEYYKWAAKVQIVLDDVLKRKPLRNMGGSVIWPGDFGYIL